MGRDAPARRWCTRWTIRASGSVSAARIDQAGERPLARVPLVGRIAAGVPILAEQAIEAIIPLPRQLGR